MTNRKETIMTIEFERFASFLDRALDSIRANAILSQKIGGAADDEELIERFDRGAWTLGDLKVIQDLAFILIEEDERRLLN
jgi:hypothetical protein